MVILVVVCSAVLLAVPVHADNVKLTSNKAREFTCPGDQVIFTCRVFRSIVLEWRNELIDQPVTYGTTDAHPVTLNRGPFTASLINVSGTPLNSNFTSTLQVTASRMFMRNETTVMCLSSTMKNKTDNFTVAEMPTVPLNVVNKVKRGSHGGNTNISITWIRPQNIDQFDIDCYDISVTSTSDVQHMTTACGECTNTTVTVTENPSNVPLSTIFTITISARNWCGENGPTATGSYTLIDCGSPVTPWNGSLESYTDTTEGSEVFYSCDPGLVPEGRRTAVCTRDGWSPNPADLNCIDIPQDVNSGTVAGTVAGTVVGSLLLILLIVVILIIVCYFCLIKKVVTDKRFKYMKLKLERFGGVQEETDTRVRYMKEDTDGRLDVVELEVDRVKSEQVKTDQKLADAKVKTDQKFADAELFVQKELKEVRDVQKNLDNRVKGLEAWVSKEALKGRRKI